MTRCLWQNSSMFYDKSNYKFNSSSGILNYIKQQTIRYFKIPAMLMANFSEKQTDRHHEKNICTTK